MNNVTNAYHILSKLNFSNLSVGNVTTPFYDNNNAVNFTWSQTGTPTIKEVEGVKVMNFSTQNSKIYITTPIVTDNIKTSNLFFEADIKIPNLLAEQIFFSVGTSNSNSTFRFSIKSTFKNGLVIWCNNMTVNCNFKFENNVSYNIAIMKDQNVFTFMIDGLVVGYCDSKDFTNNMNTLVSNYYTIGGKWYGSITSNDALIGDISNINILVGNSKKYDNSFTKYGDNLISRLNFGNLATTSSATEFTCGLESVENSSMNWIYGDITVKDDVATLDGTQITSNIPNTSTLTFKMINKKNVDNIELLNLNDNYKIIYTYNVKGAPEPDVIVNDYTTSALNFEDGIVDKVGTTIWNKEGIATVQNINKIFGENSFETKALGDSLYTNNNIITGGSTPYTIEFYALVKSDNLQPTSSYHPIITSSNLYGNGGGSQGLFLNKNTNQLMYQRTVDIEPNFGTNGNIELNNIKILYNEINKITIAFDGVALRFFINDVLDYVIGTNTGYYIRSFFILYGHSTASKNTTKGIIDNINIHDGLATKVRDFDPYEEYLVVDLAFDGENNSTKIVDNGYAKSVWSVNGSVKLSTNQKFDGFSSLYLDGNGDRLSTPPNQNLIISNNIDFTISFEFIVNDTSKLNYLLSKRASASETPSQIARGGYAILVSNKISFFGWYGTSTDNVAIELISEIIQQNVKYKVDIVRKNMHCYLYVNGILHVSNIQTNEFTDANYITYIGQDKDTTNQPIRDFNGYIKNFKMYKGTAIIPESHTGKIQLDFDNNVIDKYGNSTWTNNGLVFDQINSVKGNSVKSVGELYKNIYSNSLTLNLKNNIYDFDFKVTDVSDYRIITGNKYLFIYISKTNANVYFEFYNSGAWITGYQSNVKIELNKWYNLKFVSLNDKIFIYVNDIICDVIETPYINLTTVQDIQYISGNYGQAGYMYSGYIDNFRFENNTVINIDNINKPVVFLPLETNAINTGFTPLTVNSVGNPTYTVVDGKKCIKFESGKYLTINTNNIFNLGSNSDFYMEFDFNPLITSNNPVLVDSFKIGSANTYQIQIETTGIIIYLQGTSNIISNLLPISNTWNNLKFFRFGNNITIILNGNTYTQTISQSLTNTGIFSLGAQVESRNGTYDFNGYMSNFKMFVGTSEITESYNDKKVLDLDFKPTGKSYLFKDNNNKCIIHPVNITQRDYQDSQYCCSFNGTNQYLQLGVNDLLNFGNDDFIINIKFKFFNRGVSGNFLMSGGVTTNTSNYWYIQIRSSQAANNPSKIEFVYRIDANNVYNVVSNVNMVNNTIYDAYFIRNGNTMKLIINDDDNNVESDVKLPVTFNLNANNNTFIGVNAYDKTTMLFNGVIYYVKVLRNTTDLSLLEDEQFIYASEEKFVLTNGVDEAQEITFTEIKDHDIKVVTDNDKISLHIDEDILEVAKTTEVDNISLFDGYIGSVKDLRVYDIAMYDDDEYIGSELIDTQYPELEIVDDVDEYQVIDVGEYNIKGFIEGGTDIKYYILNKVHNFELHSGIGDYEYFGIDYKYIDDYEIYEVVSKQRYPLYKHEMKKGYISGTVNIANCGVKRDKLKVYCYRNDNNRLIGIYKLDEYNRYEIPNLDVNSKYDIIFKDDSRKIENISSSYRTPKEY